MKDSLWEVDRAGGVGFRDSRDEQAETLFDLDEPMLAALPRALEHRLRQSGPTRVEELRDFALFEPVYRPERVIGSLQPLIDRGDLLKANGQLRRSTIVEFAPAQKP